MVFIKNVFCQVQTKVYSKNSFQYGCYAPLFPNAKVLLWIVLFCCMVKRRKTFSLISGRNLCQGSSPSRISDTPHVGLEPARNLSSRFVERNCTSVITTTPRYHNYYTRCRDHWKAKGACKYLSSDTTVPTKIVTSIGKIK